MPTLALEPLRGLTGRLVTLGLLHALWIGLLAASLAAIALRLMSRRSPSLRYHALMGLLLAAALGPVAAAMLQRRAVEPPSIRPVADPDRTLVAFPGRLLDGPDPTPNTLRSEKAAPPSPSPFAVASRRAVRAASDAIRLVQPFALAAWLAIASTLAAILAVGLVSARRLRTSARPACPTLQARSDRLADRLGLRRQPPVLLHADLAEPCLLGLVRPAILLPAGWLDAIGDGPLDAILAHELAHARRLDLPVNLLQRLVEASLFFHPSVLWLSATARRHRERCADAMAVALTGDPLALALALESVARLRVSPRSSRPLVAALGGESPGLLPRIQELLGMTPPRPPARRWPLAALPASALIALLSASLGLADDPPVADASPKARDWPVGKKLEDIRIHPGENVAFEFEPSATPTIDWKTEKVPYSERQISYEVRYLEGMPAGAWREAVRDRLRPVDDESADHAWVLDHDAVHDLLTVAQNDIRTNLIQAPKVTQFEGAHATVMNTKTLPYVADLKEIRTPDSLAFQPSIKKVEIGSKIELSGTRLDDGGIRLSVDLSDRSLVAMHTLPHRAEHSGQAINAQYQVPTTTETRLTTEADLPDGATIAVSLGLYDDPAPLKGAAEIAVGLLQLAGAPPLEPRARVCERLVLITPRVIILEEEEERLDARTLDLKLVPGRELNRAGLEFRSGPSDSPKPGTPPTRP